MFENKLCFRCLLRNHVARSCKRCCSSCKGAHHESLCYGVEKSKPKEEKSNEKTECDENATLSVDRSSVSFLPTATVKVKGEGGKWVEATLLFDSGSDQSYVARSLVHKTKPKWVRNAQSKFSSFGGHSHKTQSRVFEINIKGVKKETEEAVIQVTEVPVICLPLVWPQVDTEMLQKFEHLNLAYDFVGHSKSMDIDILIGQDLFWTLMSGNVYRTEDSGVVAQQSIFGWVLSGAENRRGGKFVEIGSTTALLNLNDTPDHVVKSFWDLESIGVGEKESVVDPVLERFEQNIGYNMKTGRYKVNLAWKENPPVLANTFRLAKSRLLGLEKRLERKAELKTGYDGASQEMVNNGHVVEVNPNSKPEGPVFYLPHHPHVRESRTTTKIRPVFDASARGSNGISLNDSLESGPNINPTVMGLLIRFRRWRYALSVYIQKAFLQVELDERDQDVHRFLWLGYWLG